jgi:hypothetical protein
MMSGRSSYLAIACLTMQAYAQLPLTPKVERQFSQILDGKGKYDPLDCEITPIKPFLDFSFRYALGYIVRCKLAQFGGKKTSVGALLKVKNEEKTVTTFGQSFVFPAVPEDRAATYKFKRNRLEWEVSGVVATGEGAYEVELIVLDEHNRAMRKSWKAEAKPRGKESHAAPAIPAGKILPASLPPWEGTTGNTGLTLTVLLDAAPMNQAAFELHAWDRAFLLGALSSLLRPLQLASVRLVVFNLDQQREVFQEDDFDHSGMLRLAERLNDLELGTISYKALRRTEGWAELLTRMLQREEFREQSSDAVIFLGPNARIISKVPWPIFEGKTGQPPLFYFEYLPPFKNEFPDAIEHVVSARGGSTYKIRSPGDLAQAIVKLKSELAARVREQNRPGSMRNSPSALR